MSFSLSGRFLATALALLPLAEAAKADSGDRPVYGQTTNDPFAVCGGLQDGLCVNLDKLAGDDRAAKLAEIGELNQLPWSGKAKAMSYAATASFAAYADVPKVLGVSRADGWVVYVEPSAATLVAYNTGAGADGFNPANDPAGATVISGADGDAKVLDLARPDAQAALARAVSTFRQAVVQPTTAQPMASKDNVGIVDSDTLTNPRTPLQFAIRNVAVQPPEAYADAGNGLARQLAGFALNEAYQKPYLAVSAATMTGMYADFAAMSFSVFNMKPVSSGRLAVDLASVVTLHRASADDILENASDGDRDRAIAAIRNAMDLRDAMLTLRAPAAQAPGPRP